MVTPVLYVLNRYFSLSVHKTSAEMTEQFQNVQMSSFPHLVDLNVGR